MVLTQLIPSIECNDLAESIEFYRDILGFEVTSFYPGDEMPYWAMLTRDGVSFMITERNAHAQHLQTSFTGSFYVYPDDVMAVWQEVTTKIDPSYIEWPLEVFDYGMQEFAIKDPNGYLWRFGQEVEENHLV